MNKNALKCNCGQPIQEKDVMQTGLYARMFGPSFVYVRYRCSRCKRKLEKFVKQDEWNESALFDNPHEANDTEQSAFEQMGPIEMNEQFEFHEHLNTMPSLRDFNRHYASEHVRDIPSEEPRPARKDKRKAQ